MKLMKKRAPWLIRTLVSALLIGSATTLPTIPAWAWIGPGANHPERHWKTFATEHFTVHYYQGFEQLAKLSAQVAEDGFATLTADLGYTPKDKIPLILNEDEFWNGYAEPLRNRIVLDPRFCLTGPIGLNRFILHELTHILNFGAIDDGRPMGRLVKAAGLPSWFAEGLAQYEAEYWAPETDRMLRLHAINHTLLTPHEREAFGALGKGSEGYNEGYAIVRYLAKTYGRAKLPELLRTYRSLNIDFNKAIELTFGKSVIALEGEWREHIAYEYAEQIKDREVTLPHAQELIGYRPKQSYYHARYSPDGKWMAFLYSRGYPLIRGHMFPIMPLVVASSEQIEKASVVNGGKLPETQAPNETRNPVPEPRPIPLRHGDSPEVDYSSDTSSEAKIDRVELAERALDLAWAPDSRQIAITTLKPNAYGNTTTHVGLVKLRINNDGKPEREGDLIDLTPQATAHSPTWSPDGKTLAMVLEEGERDRIVLLDIATRQVTQVLLEARDFRQYQALNWSPDGQWIAAEVMLPGEGGNLLLIDPKTGRQRQLSESSSMYADKQPIWAPDSQSLYFSSTRTGYTDLFRYQLSSGTTAQLSQVYTGVESPALSSDGQKLVFMRHHAEGTSLERVKLEQLRPIQEAPETISDGLLSQPDLNLTPIALEPESKPYAPGLGFEYLIPVIGRDEKGEQIGFLSQFSDLLQQHAVNAIVLYGLASSRFGYSLAYINQMFDPTLGVQISDSPTLSFTTGGEYFFLQREQQLSLFVNRPLFNEGTGDTGATRIRRFGSLEFSTSYNTSLREELREVTTSRELREGFTNVLSAAFNGIEGRAGDGFRYSLNLSGASNIWGSQYQYIAGSADWRHYIPVFGEHTLAYRLSGTAISGETRPALLGGPPLNNLLILNFQDILPLRGFRLAELQGPMLMAGSLEYRFPIVRDLNWNLGNNYLTGISAAAFTDFGDAWYPAKRNPYPHVSAGLELRAQTVINARTNFQLFLGVGKSLIGNNITPLTRPVEFYGGFANVF